MSSMYPQSRNHTTTASRMGPKTYYEIVHFECVERRSNPCFQALVEGRRMKGDEGHTRSKTLVLKGVWYAIVKGF